jgi:co-chaperonin GroES (HSP10)
MIGEMQAMQQYNEEKAAAESVVKPLSAIGDPSQIKNTSGLEPVGCAVLLLPYKPDINSSPLYIPESVGRRLDMIEMRGIVVAIGPEAWKDEKPRAEIGDKVLVSAFCGSILRGPLDDVQYRLVNCGDIYAKIVAEKESNNG